MMSAALVDKSMLAGVDDLATILDPQGLEKKVVDYLHKQQDHFYLGLDF